MNCCPIRNNYYKIKRIKIKFKKMMSLNYALNIGYKQIAYNNYIPEIIVNKDKILNYLYNSNKFYRKIFNLVSDKIPDKTFKLPEVIKLKNSFMKTSRKIAVSRINKKKFKNDYYNLVNKCKTSLLLDKNYNQAQFVILKLIIGHQMLIRVLKEINNLIKYFQFNKLLSENNISNSMKNLINHIDNDSDNISNLISNMKL